MTRFNLSPLNRTTPFAYLIPVAPRRHALTALAALAVLAGCGGGGSDDSGGAPGATASAYTAGTLSGFGSIIVNGVRFDDSAASVVDDNGGLRSVSSLKLGMRVEVTSDSVTSSGTAKASKVHFGSQLEGPVASVGSSTLTVLGQVVDVTSATVFDSSLAAGLSAVAVGAVVEVHGVVDSTTGHLVATRVETASSTSSYKLSGTVTALDTTAKTLSIGAAVVNYTSAASVPSTLAVGTSVRLKLATTPSNGQWVATSFGSTKKQASDGQVGHVRGLITSFTSNASFSVGGFTVDASAVTVPTGLAVGVGVEVEGTVTNGVLVASKVKLEDERGSGRDDKRFELHGSITAIDTTAKTFTLRGVTVSYSGTVTYKDGTEANLAVGRKVEVKGAVGSTRSQVQAATIDFES